MGVIGGRECFRGGSRCGVPILQFGSEVREAILRERSNPFRDHDGHSVIDIGTDPRE
jgi:hypothetical protein